MTHTKGPWILHDRTNQSHPFVEIRAQDGGQSIAYRYAASRQEAASFRRIVSCVNALEGLNPEAVADVVAALERLNRYEGHMVYCGHGKDDTKPCVCGLLDAQGQARTALARIRGEG